MTEHTMADPRRVEPTIAVPTTAEGGEPTRHLLAWVVPGQLLQPTGGYLYDARMVQELQALGWQIGIINVGSRGWPLDVLGAGRLVHALGQHPWAAVAFDELAHPAMAPGIPWARLARSCPDAVLVGLVHHLRASEPAPPARRWLARAVERRALAGLDAIVCTSRYTAGTVRALLGEAPRVEVVPPGFDTQSLGVADAEGQGRATGEPGALRVLAVAHWTPRKGILEMLRAIAEAPRGVTLDLVGDRARDPDYAARVDRALRHPALADRVRVHGVVSSEQLAALYAAADAFLLASSHEGYGMVLAEALRMGLPIVATRVGAVPELVGDEAGAELVASGDPGALARALRRLADDPEGRTRRSAAASTRGRTLPSWRESAARFDGIVRDALAVRSGRAARSSIIRPETPGAASSTRSPDLRGAMSP